MGASYERYAGRFVPGVMFAARPQVLQASYCFCIYRLVFERTQLRRWIIRMT